MKKRILKVLVVTIIAICSFLLVACNSENYKSGRLKKTTAVAPIVYDVSEKERAVEKAATVDLSTLSKDVNADGATVLSNDVTTITSAGSYILTGAYAGITVSVGNGETAHLFLNDATISGGAGIAISNTNKKSTLIITACENTENEVASKGDDANAIHVKGTLKINGTGTINVSAKKNGIKVSKGLSIADSTLNVTAGNHALSARFIEAENAKINVLSAGKDALNAECDDETQEFTLDEGYVSLKSSKVFASVSGDGIQADTFVYITGGSVDIKTAATFVRYGAESMATYDLSEDDFRYIKSGDTYKKIDDVATKGARYAMTQSAKGIKCGEIKYEIDGTEYAVTKNTNYFIVIDGARVKIDSSDDAIHTNSGNVLIKGGTLDLTTLDDGIHADELVKIDGGEITVNGSYEGIEGAYVEIGGGTIYITASDDGINAASDDESVNEHIIISNVTYSSASAALVLELCEDSLARSAGSFLAAFIILYTSEFMPKLLCAARPLRRILALAPVYRVMERILHPLTMVGVAFTDFFVKRKDMQEKLTSADLMRILEDRKDGVRLSDFESALIGRLIVLRVKGRPITPEAILSALRDFD